MMFKLIVGTLARWAPVCKKMNIIKIKLRRSGLFISNAYSKSILVEVMAIHPMFWTHSE